MLRTDLGRFGRGLSSLLVELLRPLFVDAVPVLFSIQPAVLPVVGSLVLVAGAGYLLQLLTRRGMAGEDLPHVADLMDSGLTFAYCWIGIGLVLTFLSAIGLLPLLVTLLGLLATMALHHQATVEEKKMSRRLEWLRRQGRAPRLSAVAMRGILVKAALLGVAYISLIYGSFALADFYRGSRRFSSTRVALPSRKRERNLKCPKNPLPKNLRNSKRSPRNTPTQNFALACRTR